MVCTGTLTSLIHSTCIISFPLIRPAICIWRSLLLGQCWLMEQLAVEEWHNLVKCNGIKMTPFNDILDIYRSTGKSWWARLYQKSNRIVNCLYFMVLKYEPNIFYKNVLHLVKNLRGSYKVIVLVVLMISPFLYPNLQAFWEY